MNLTRYKPFQFRWDAANEHMTTALLGMLGELTALALEESSDFNYMYDL